jgi:hypothetical protein
MTERKKNKRMREDDEWEPNKVQRLTDSESDNSTCTERSLVFPAPSLLPRRAWQWTDEPVLDDCWRDTPMDHGCEFYHPDAVDWFKQRITVHVAAWRAEEQRLNVHDRRLKEEEQEVLANLPVPDLFSHFSRAEPYGDLKQVRQQMLWSQHHRTIIDHKLMVLAALPARYTGMAERCQRYAVDQRPLVWQRPQCMQPHGTAPGNAEDEAWSMYLERYFMTGDGSDIMWQRQEERAAMRLDYFRSRQKLERAARFYAMEPRV